jgi:hypothetical protein
MRIPRFQLDLAPSKFGVLRLRYHKTKDLEVDGPEEASLLTFERRLRLRFHETKDIEIDGREAA